MLNLIFKDFHTISRDKSEVLILLAMPLILIIILGFALGGLMSGEEGIDRIPVALVMENDFEKDLEDFQEVMIQEGIPEEEIEQVITSYQESDPAKSFMGMITSSDLEEVIDLRLDYSAIQAEEAVIQGDLAAVITIPERFSYDTATAIYLDKEPEASIDLFVQDEGQIRADIVKNILTNFKEHYNLELSIFKVSDGVPFESAGSGDFGEITYLSTEKSVSVSQYYTIGMAVLFALYVASTVASNAFKEKASHVFARLMLTGESPLRYLLSKGVSATVLSIMQLTILFSASSLIFKTFGSLSTESAIGMAIVTLVFSLTIGSLTTLITAISLKVNSESVSGIFSGIIVIGFAFIGGSMLPIEQMPLVLHEIGKWTPNGAMMNAYLQLIQGFELYDVLPMIYRSMIMIGIFMVSALVIFPKRRLM